MDTTTALVESAILVAAVLLWAKWSKLDLGLRRPALRGSWPWIAAYLIWAGAGWGIELLVLPNVDPEWLEWLESLSPLEDLVIVVVLTPIVEELMFRGAMFAALIRRWGIWPAAIVPSILWALIHVQYETWFVAWLACQGVLLAIARWKSGSLYVPMALHAAYNSIGFLIAHVL